MGDEGGANDTFNNARFIDKDFFAAIYRLDVDRKPANLKPNLHHQDSHGVPLGGAYRHLQGARGQPLHQRKFI